MATKTTKRVSAKKMCRAVIKHPGINSKTGQLKKGWKYESGTPVKAAPKKTVKKKVETKGLKAVKRINWGYNAGSKIELNSLKPLASLESINKIIDGKVIRHNVDQAVTTKSIYLTFEEPTNDKYFKIRMSDHSKIDGLDDDTIEYFQDDIEVNIFSKERKTEALDFLKDYFSKIPKLPSDTKHLFTNKVVKRVLKMKYAEPIEAYFKKKKIDTSKTKNQVTEQVHALFLKLKPTGVLTKREYSKVRGTFKFTGEQKYEGVITDLTKNGSMATINRQTGKDFTVDKPEHKALLEFIKGNHTTLELFLKSKK